MRSNFDASFSALMRSESGYQDDPRDSGNRLPDGRAGATNWGITQKVWEAYTNRKVTKDDMRALTQEMVKPVYITQYWNAVKGDTLPRGIDYLTFDLAVNAGPARAAKTLQQALGITADGIIGPHTTNAAAFADAPSLAQKFTDVKISFYKSLNSPVYERGWVNRANEALAIANRMIASA